MVQRFDERRYVRSQVDAIHQLLAGQPQTAGVGVATAG